MAPVLGYPNPALDYILDTDASLNWVGAVLSQIQENRPMSKHGNANGLSRRPCHDYTKYERVTKQCGGPSMSQIQIELSERAQHENPVCTRIAGEEQIAQECADDLLEENRTRQVIGTVCEVSARSGPKSSQTASLILTDGDGCCMVEDSSTCDNCQNDKEQRTFDYSSNQQEVKNQQSLDPAIVNLGSTELQKLSPMLSLMRIREDQVLVTRILVEKRAWEDAIPLPGATAPVMAEALDSLVFCYFGLPEELHKDRETLFEGDLMAELWAM
ncbi:uncharacterized protein [Watersipora subatra]|uniref:uncharacterized protein n=1 Tax=Watersipora subatra TaxID=2589382 RepID=UPI00355AF511